MGWLSNFFSGSKLSASDRSTITRLLGSFNVNSLLDKGDNELIKQGYTRNIEVYSVVRKIVETSKNGEWKIEEKQSDGTYEEITDTTIHELFNTPNPFKGYTWNDVCEMAITYLLVNGNSYLTGVKPEGFSQISAIEVLPPNYVEIYSNSDFFYPELKYHFNMGASSKYFIPEENELQHIKLFNPHFNSVEESMKGLSIVQVASMVVQASNDKWQADAALLQNKGVLGLITDSSDRPMTPDEAAKTQESFNNDMGGAGKFGRLKVTNKDLKYINLAMTSTDLQLIEKDVSYLRAVCNVFGVSSSLFNDPTNKTYNNQKEAVKSLYTNVIIPISRKLCENFTQFIAKNHYPDRDIRITQDFSSVESLQSDKAMEAVKDKVNMEAINLVLQMPVSNDAKVQLLQDNFDLSQELLAQIEIGFVVENAAASGSLEDGTTEEAIIRELDAQANLRGSVGGVQGIIALQQGVADGITSEGSAISTLVEIYGFDEPTARQILGL